MRITVERVIEEGIVEISSHMGRAIVACYQHNLQAGKVYGVEFDVTDSIQLGVNAAKVSDKAFFIKHDNKMNYIQGESEGIDEFGILCFRLSMDCLIMMDSDDINIKEGDQLNIQIDIGKLEMTVIGI